MIPAREPWRSRLRTAGFHLLVWTLVAAVSAPLVWLLVNTVNPITVERLARAGVVAWFRNASLDGYRYALLNTSFPRYLFNSVLAATASAAASTGLAVFGGYALARLEFRGRRIAAVGLLSLLAVPQSIVALPLFLWLRRLGLYNTRAGLILAYVAFTLPFVLWLLRSLFGHQPASIEAAAMVDGCTRLGAVLRVFVPVARPAIAAGFVFAWLLAYNEYLFALILINDADMRTIPIGVEYAAGGSPLVAAALASLPTVAVSALLLRALRGGLADGLGSFRK